MPGDRQNRLDWRQRRFLALLGLPSFGLALSSTMVTTYLPVFIQELSGPVMTGVLIGAEGMVALVLPPMVGAWSDSLGTRIGGRLPFLLIAAPLAVIALILMPLVGSLVALAILLLAFYASYFTYYAPYRALFPDLVPDRVRGRSQSAPKTWRELGLVSALVGGGILLAAWRPLPFLLAALIVLLATALFVRRFAGESAPGAGGGGTDNRKESEDRKASSPGEVYGNARELLRDRTLRRLLTANALWELTLGAIKAFVVLFFVVGLERSTSFASGVLALAAAAIIGAALIGGTLADRIGHVRLIRGSAAVYGAALLIPLISQSPWVIATVPFGAFAGGIVMTLSFSLVMGVMPKQRHGIVSGVFELSRGAGTLLGPLIAGIAIAASQPLLSSTEGYAAMWAVASAATLATIPLLGRLDRDRIETE